jgi:predicted RNA-binding Zn ribbon-like protein
MDFSHYTDEPVDLAVNLMNTASTSTDALDDIDGLREFLSGYHHMWNGVARPPKASDVAAVRRLRKQLRLVIESPDQATASDRLNEILTRHHAQPRVSLHNGAPHLHFEPVDSDMCSWLGAVTAMGLASVMVEHGIERFGKCAAGDCDDVYVDASRNRSRRHCSSTCSTREAVSAYRRRQMEETGS